MSESNPIMDICDEMVVEGHLVKLSEGVYQKTGGHGFQVDVSHIELPDDPLPDDPEFIRQLKVTLLALMERPDIMGEPVDPNDPEMRVAIERFQAKRRAAEKRSPWWRVWER